jgi:hypothetical protein
MLEVAGVNFHPGIEGRIGCRGRGRIKGRRAERYAGADERSTRRIHTPLGLE